MRRHLVLAAAIAGLLVVSGCGSDSTAKRTVTAVVTVSSGAEVPASDAPSGSVDPSAPPESAAASSDAPGSSAAPSSSSVAPAPFVAVDPLKADCAAVMSAADVKKIFNIDIPNDRLKVNVAEVNGDIGQTGRVRCFYGVGADRKSGAFTLALTQYADAPAAQKQVDVTVQNESDNGGEVSQVTVNGYPATVSLRDGGLIIMAYDNWTLAIAEAQPIDPALVAAGLPQLAEATLTRILKG